MFGSRVRSKLVVAVTAPIIATMAIIGASPSAAFATQKSPVPAPVVESFTASSTSLTYLGGPVVLSASLEYASSCKMTVSPALKGFSKSFPCSTSVTRGVTLHANRTANTLDCSFALTVKNKTATVAATNVTVTEAAIPAPVVSTFAATSTSLPYTGGKTVLSASFVYGSSCDMAVTPGLRGFPKSFACKKGLTLPVALPANTTANALSYSFALTVENKPQVSWRRPWSSLKPPFRPRSSRRSRSQVPACRTPAARSCSRQASNTPRRAS